MVRILLLFAAFPFFALPVWADDSPLAAIDRTIEREPEYRNQPRYALLVLGAEAEAAVWIVEDGKQLYVDRNGNRDLTDDGPPISATNERHLFFADAGPSWDMDYLLDVFTLPDGTRQTNFRLAHWNYGDPEDKYGLALTLDGEIPMYSGWVPLLKESPEDAPVIHFGAPVAPRMLRYKEFVPGTTPSRFSIGFFAPGLGDGATSRLSIDALPETEQPVVLIEWPVAEGSSPLTTTHVLTERCCYWEFYTETFQVPGRAVPGTAVVTVTVPLESFPLELSTNRFEAPVVAASE